jgi:deoxyribose-phosphate aldolase
MTLQPKTPSVCDIARMIDHSLLHPTLTPAQLQEGYILAAKYGCATVCVQPMSVVAAKAALEGSNTQVCAVAGFPQGANCLETKVMEAERSISEGATEIDVVVNAGLTLGGHWDIIQREIEVMNATCVRDNAILKVIFENDFLQDEHIIKLCEICTAAEVAFVKTSTGYGMVKQPDGSYGYKGATPAHLKLMREHSGPNVQIKAAGGVRTLDDTLAVRALGVSRIGATATAAIVQAAIDRGMPGPIPAGLAAGATPPKGGDAPGY